MQATDPEISVELCESSIYRDYSTETRVESFSSAADKTILAHDAADDRPTDQRFSYVERFAPSFSSHLRSGSIMTSVFGITRKSKNKLWSQSEMKLYLSH